MAFQTGTTSYSLDVPSSYVHARGAGTGKPLLLFLHGYADSASSFLRRAMPEPDPRFEILAPNAPFPLPKFVDGEWKAAYGWYFADLSAKRIYVHPRVAAGAVAGLVERLGLADRPKVLVGFSQGGYFLPHLARELREVRRFIAIGAGFHPEYFAEFGLTKANVHAIHGAGDEVIPFAEAKGDFERLGSWNRGEFVAIPGMTHAINEEGAAALARLLTEPLP
jgi:predicted esterase